MSTFWGDVIGNKGEECQLFGGMLQEIEEKNVNFWRNVMENMASKIIDNMASKIMENIASKIIENMTSKIIKNMANKIIENIANKIIEHEHAYINLKMYLKTNIIGLRDMS